MNFIFSELNWVGYRLNWKICGTPTPALQPSQTDQSSAFLCKMRSYADDKLKFIFGSKWNNIYTHVEVQPNVRFLTTNEEHGVGTPLALCARHHGCR